MESALTAFFSDLGYCSCGQQWAVYMFVKQVNEWNQYGIEIVENNF